MIDKYLEIKSIDPEYWGKCGWIFLNSVALTYDPVYREHYRLFITQLPFVLPCKTCGENLKQNMGSLDAALESKEQFVWWLIRVRNGIYADNHEEWKQKNFRDTIGEIFDSQQSTSNTYGWFVGMAIVLVLLVLILYYMKGR